MKKSTLNNGVVGMVQFQRQAFTLTELLVVIAIVTVLAASLLPALAKPGSRPRVINCLNNLRQLQSCWLMYAGDYTDTIVSVQVQNIGDGDGAGHR